MMPTDRYQYRDGDVAFTFWLSEPGPDGSRLVLATISDLTDPVALFDVVAFPAGCRLPVNDPEADQMATYYCQALSRQHS